MTTCEELIGFLGDYVAGELPPERRERFEKHLAACPSCREYLRSYRLTIQAARGALPNTPDIEDVPPEVLTAILATIAGKAPE